MADVVEKPTHRVLVADAVSPRSVELLRSTPGFEVTFRTGMSAEELLGEIGGHDALIVRSATRVTRQVLASPGRLRVIGRAGTGVDNIDLDAATRAGVVVLNTPGGNSVAAAELTFSLLLALARNVPRAHADMRAGRWERKLHVGVEVAGKVLGVVGLGRIGREVVRRAHGFRMEVLGHDPFVPAAVAEDHGIRSVGLEELAARSDFITLHLPLVPDTRHLFDDRLLALVKPGARLINCARGGLVDEQALLRALEAGRLAGAALDVFETEPPTDRRLVEHPLVVCTPHLGASTHEAQERVGFEIAEKIREFLQSGVILDAVNFPSIGRDEHAALMPLMDLAERLGTFLGQIADGGMRRFEIRTLGSLAEHPVRPLAMAATKGLLSRVVEGGVSFVNALARAEERRLTVEESRSSEPTPFAGLLRLTLETEQGRISVAGTLLGPGHARVVEIDGMPIEARPEGHLLFFRNQDVPGVVGRIGTILGRAQVNIASIALGRPNDREMAVSIFGVDSEVPADVLAEIRRLPEVLLVRSVTV
jgi:D-3-phosphoglycerate dehydrogenase